MATGAALLDTTRYVRVNQGLNPIILQAHRDTVRIAFNASRPATSNEAFHQLSGADPIYSVPALDTDVWALAMTSSSSLIVTEFDGDPGENPIDTLQELAMLVLQQTSKMIIDNAQIVGELKLLNARIEDAFETGVEAADT